MSYQNLVEGVMSAAKTFLEMSPSVTADVSGAADDTIFTMDATGLSEGWYALDYFPSGTTILSIGGIAPDNTVEFSAGKLTSGTDSVRFLSNANGYEGLGLVSGTSIEWPNMDFTPPSNGAYACVTNLPIGSNPITMGLGGDDENLGILQLSLYFPMQEGQGALLTAVSRAKHYFSAGSTITRNGSVVTFLRTKESPFAKADNRLACHLSIYWRGRTTRPTSLIHTS